MPQLDSNDPTIDVGQALGAEPTPTFVQPKPADIVLCSYPDTLDGVAAAWVIYKVAKRDKIAVEFVMHDAGKVWTPPASRVVDRHWIAICDTGVPMGTYGKTLLTFCRTEVAAKPPIPYRSWKRVWPYGLEDITLGAKSCGVHNDKQSLCRTVWEYFLAERVGFDKPPRILSHIDDFVTKSNRYNDSAEIATTVDSYPHELPIFDQLAVACEDRRRREAMIASGQGIMRWQAKHKT